MRSDQYNSVLKRSEGLYKEKGSKFISFLDHLASIEDHKRILEEIKALHPKANHHCYAFRIGIDGNPFKSSDDGEPSGTAGKPILNELLSSELSSVQCTVVRYFGGSKLGTSGLIRAYKNATRMAIENASIEVITLTKSVRIHYDISEMGKIFNILKNLGVENLRNTFEPKPLIEFELSLQKLDNIRSQIISKYVGYEVDENEVDKYSNLIHIQIDE